MSLQYLDIAAIQSICNNRTFDRGESYHRRHQVIKTEWVAEENTLYSQVRGSEHDPYRQEIQLYYDHEMDMLHIEGECSCPVGWDCKHVVAALLSVMSRKRPLRARSERHSSPLSGAASWMEDIRLEAQEETEAASITDTGKYVTLFTLKPVDEAEKPQSISVQALKSYPLKKGGWAKPRPISLDGYNYHYYYHNIFRQSPEEDLLSRLRQKQRQGRLSLDPHIEGDEGAFLLRRMLNTGRCYWLDIQQSPILHLSTSRTLSWHWHEQQEGQKLHFALQDADDDWLLIPTDPPHYLFPHSGECGEINTPLTGNQLRQLRRLPVVDEADQVELSSFLYQHFEQVQGPVEIPIQRAKGPCVPHLKLTCIHDRVPLGGLHIAELSFHYSDIVVVPYAHQAEAHLRFERDGIHYEVQRDLKGENGASQQLLEWGWGQPEVLNHNREALHLTFAPIGESRMERAQKWQTFLDRDLSQLEQQGWVIELDPNFALQFHSSAQFSGQISQQQDWFNIGLEIQWRGQALPLLPLLVQWLEEYRTLGDEQTLWLEVEDHQWLAVPSAVLKPIVNALIELYDTPLDAQGRLQLPNYSVNALLGVEQQLQVQDPQFVWKAPKRTQKWLQKVKDFRGLEPIDAPEGLEAELRDYQSLGVAWMNFLQDFGFAGILADDMGLGKTIQVLTFLLQHKPKRKIQTTLVVAPTSLLSNWQREAERFTPTLRTAIYHGPQRAEVLDQKLDILITSYALLARDFDTLQAQGFHRLVLDEAQAIKNPKAKSSIAAHNLDVAHRLCITGTPLENHLGELWSQFHFLMPHFLGDQAQFNQHYRHPIERQQDAERQVALQQRIAPFMLRRSKQQVANELPPKTEILRHITLDSAQAKLYESVRLSMQKKVRKLLQEKGLARSHIQVLDALLKMRQVCCDPQLLKTPSAQKVRQSAKLEALMEMLPELLEEGRKVLIFSQFTSMLSLIEAGLKDLGIGYSKLTGQTRKRDEAIQRFQSGEVPVFLISLKAGGFGLNLTEADTVIHYDPWWNPAVENQATDRAHRIGQDKPVFVYKLICQNTVEEKILALQARKQALADAVHGPQQTQGFALDSEQLLSLFAED